MANTNIYDLLKNIKKRPSAYLYNPSITHLHTLLAGYDLAKMEQNIPPTEQDFEFDKFQQWIQKKYDILSTLSWATIILENSQDEKDALNKFFELFEEFTNEVSQTEISQT
jgi:hypothetical protein